jgi:hypothetical protein
MTDDPWDPRCHEHMKWLGHVAPIWASLELEINMTIWELANVERWVGACMTSQLFSPSSRTRVLLSLVHIRGASKEIVDKVNRFSSKVTGLGRRRNEYIHDAWCVEETTGEVKRIHAAMEETFTFGFTPTSTKELQRLYVDIEDAISRFQHLRNETFQSLPPYVLNTMYTIFSNFRFRGGETGWTVGRDQFDARSREVIAPSESRAQELTATVKKESESPLLLGPRIR